MCDREVWFDAQQRWRPSVGSVRCRAKRGSVGGESVQRRVAGACRWDFEEASVRRAWVCPFTGAACAHMRGAGGNACVYVGSARTRDVTRLGDRLDMFLHPSSVRGPMCPTVLCVRLRMRILYFYFYKRTQWWTKSCRYSRTPQTVSEPTCIPSSQTRPLRAHTCCSARSGTCELHPCCSCPHSPPSPTTAAA